MTTAPDSRTDIRTLSADDLQTVMAAMGEAPFRARQVHSWIWQKSARSFDAFTNLSKELRQKLDEKFCILPIENAGEQLSNDGTVKMAFRLHDQHLIEGVLIPADDRMTACVSSQVGCSLTCAFCATGMMKRIRNLTAAEIYDQVVDLSRTAEKFHHHPLTNIVFMGMGEPLLNYKEVCEGIGRITSPDGLGMSPKRITVSTAGIAKMIRKLGDDQVRFNLALSLHAATDEKRDKVMPINEQNNLEVLMDALQYFYSKTGNRITFEYLVFKDFNDGVEDAVQLARYCGRIPARVNIIEYNHVDGVDFRQTTPERLQAFIDTLEARKVVVNVRRSRGKDIDAACGQLANKLKPGNAG
ncbi:MAG: 23S rRNA (adenine(2503)-C(2))-methyltransferase RlmN [Flavobacteriales bacterium]|nr:23S rRNA (adenine(2503)-C(2))-methyltransferase RlmN [Flavobacteriales bacterium]MCB9449721.1 23S rRNA (adenine(2503)-C(2))-methyltransferase RlmN [Flavobacteriales bacterium]